jgi:hypothetical protein
VKYLGIEINPLEVLGFGITSLLDAASMCKYTKAILPPSNQVLEG